MRRCTSCAIRTRSRSLLYPLGPLAWVARTAQAAAGSDGPGADAGGGDSLLPVLFILAVVGAAYLLTHFVVERLQRRLLFRSGLEYVLLGVVLGPTVVDEVVPLGNLTALGPVFAFTAGWVGLLYGLELRVAVQTFERPLRVALTDAVVTGGLVFAAAYGVLNAGWLIPAPAPADAALVAGVLGCAAAAGSSSAVDVLAQRYREAETHLLPMLRRTARLGDAVAISAFGVLFAIFHNPTGRSGELGASDWVLFTLGLGVFLGVLFYFFLGTDEGENNVFLAMVGILLFASGAAFFLELSALTVNLVLGAVLAQYSNIGDRLRRQLERTEGPVSLLLLLFAGALWQPVDPWAAAVLTLGFVGVRWLGKVLAVILATVGTPLRGDLFRGMLAQGDAAVAMALSFQLVYDGPAVDLAYTAILSSVVFHELISPRMLRSLLVDAGELQQDVSWAGK